MLEITEAGRSCIYASFSVFQDTPQEKDCGLLAGDLYTTDGAFSAVWE
ncbi:hypothetical protein [Desulfovibrio sp. JC022]|nr:hypothetical protein [Desulfovibrio sp. JC022]